MATICWGNQNPTLEVDEDAIVSRPPEDDENGAYVQVCVWLEDEG